MSRLVALAMSVGTLSVVFLASPAARACGEFERPVVERPMRPVVTPFPAENALREADALLAQAQRLDSAAESRLSLATALEREAGAKDARAREARLAANRDVGRGFVERERLLARAETLEAEAAVDRVRASETRAEASDLRARARDLRERAVRLAQVRRRPIIGWRTASSL